MADLLDKVFDKAKERKRRIALPEAGLDERMLPAAKLVLEKGWAVPVLVGVRDEIDAMVEKTGVDISEMVVAEVGAQNELEEYANTYNMLRRKENLTLSEAVERVKHPLYFGALMVKMAKADGMVAGAYHSTADVLRPAIKVIGLKEGMKTMSSIFIMTVPNCPFGDEGTLLFADPAIIPDPTVEQLADIAIASAETWANLFGGEPRIAMLSFSTYGSAEHGMIDHVKAATELVKSRRADLLVDGELQADAALVDSVGEKKCPGSPVAGRANILVFPDLNAANIGYKLVQRMAQARAVGPICQGLNLPVNDLSRGASVDEIAATVAITAAMG